MASVQIDMGPHNQYEQQVAVVGKQCDAAVDQHIKHRRLRIPSARDFVIAIAFLSCGMTFYLLYARVYSIEQTLNQQLQHQQQQHIAAVSSVVMDASGGSKHGIQEIPIHDATEKRMNREVAGPLKLNRSKRNAHQGRSKRNAHQGDAAWNSASVNTNPVSAEDHHPFIHVTGITSDTVGIGDWFIWNTEDEDTDSLPFVLNKFVEILQPGFYFIYSQITYKDRNDFQIGHEIIRRPNCGIGGFGEEQRLLNSVHLQMDTVYLESGEALYPEDSGYVGGVFYLSANDRVGVRPLLATGQRARRFVSNQGSGCYFGMFLLSPDSYGRVAGQGECDGGGV